MDGEISIGLSSDEGVTYVTLTVGTEDEGGTLGFTIPQAIDIVETLQKAIQQGLAQQKGLVN